MSGHQNLLEKLRIVEAYATYSGDGNAAGVLTRALRDLAAVPAILFEDAFDEAFNPAMRPPQPDTSLIPPTTIVPAGPVAESV